MPAPAHGGMLRAALPKRCKPSLGRTRQLGRARQLGRTRQLGRARQLGRLRQLGSTGLSVAERNRRRSREKSTRKTLGRALKRKDSPPSHSEPAPLDRQPVKTAKLTRVIARSCRTAEPISLSLTRTVAHTLKQYSRARSADGAKTTFFYFSDFSRLLGCRV